MITRSGELQTPHTIMSLVTLMANEATAYTRGTTRQIAVAPFSGRWDVISVPGTMDRLEEKCLRTVYELAGRKAISAISFAKVRRAVGHSKREVEQACDFWTHRGILEWADCRQIALTPVGLRRADHLAKIGWRSANPF